MSSIPENVVNKSLYSRIKDELKHSMKSWPSAYGSGLLVKKYKEAGGKYKGKKVAKTTGLQRWFAEEWIDVCDYPEVVKSCGRPKGTYSSTTYQKDYPYCRPLRKVTSKSPKPVKSLSKRERESLCSKKKRSSKTKVK
jgi:hypothetical protein